MALLVIYPAVIAVLFGFALSGGPEKPRVAFANLVEPGESTFEVGGSTLDVADYAGRLFESIEPIEVDSREEAIQKVRDGEALGALVIPPDATERLRSTLGLGGGEPPTVEVYYNAEDPVKRRFVEATIESRLAEANAALSEVVLREAATYIDVIVSGGEIPLPLVGAVQILGLERSKAIIDGVADGLPEDSPDRAALEQVSRFAGLAGENLDVSQPILASIGSPVNVKQTVVKGDRTPLDAFAVALAVTVSLMFVTLLLAAGLLALEREEQAFGRLVRGLVSRTALLTEKVVLSALCAVAVTLLMLFGLAAFVGLDWSRVPAWLAALSGRRARLRGDGGRDRRPGARGPGGDAAGHPARPADRLPGPGAVGQRGSGALRRDQRHLGAVPVRSGPGGARPRHQRRRAAGAAAPSSGACTRIWRSSADRAAALRLDSTLCSRRPD